MRIVMAGASGFLGSNLAHALACEGHEVIRLVRRTPSGPTESAWDPQQGSLDTDLVSNCDVVINLAGSPTAGNPHSRTWARELEESRVRTTRLLAQTIAEAPRPPAFLAGNGISFYGDHGQEPVTESTASTGTALLTRVTRVWEDATAPAREAGARVCILRTAPVMDRRSAPLKQLATTFRFGLGARIGDGQQFFPMISLRDWVGAASWLVAADDLSGPFNFCCPRTPTNSHFTEALAQAVNRRAMVAVPAAVLRVAAGEMAPELLGSVNAQPEALIRSGYDFHDEDVREVLATALAD